MNEKKFTVFSFVNDLSYGKKNLYDEVTDAEYIAYIINKSFSYYLDTIFFANKMNMSHSLPKDMQHDFYLHSLRKRKRFTPWHKKDKDLYAEWEVIAKHFNYSISKAKQIRKFLPDEFVKELQEKEKTLEK